MAEPETPDITEMSEMEFDRLDGVDTPANGTDFLVTKSARVSGRPTPRVRYRIIAAE